MSDELDVIPVDGATETVAEIKTPESSEAEKTDAPATDEKAEAKAEKAEPSEVEKVKAAMQKRIDRLTAQRSEAERRAREYEEKIKSSAPTQKDDAPKEADFETYEDFLIAKGKHEAKKEYEAKQSEAKRLETQEAQAKENEALRQKFEASESEFRKNVPDYDDTVQVLNEAISSVNHKSAEFQAFRETLLSSENMPALSYHLGKNPDLLDEMQTLKPIQIVRRLIALEMGIKPADKKVAAPLPQPVKSPSGKGGFNKPLGEMTAAEIDAWRRAK